MDTHETKVYIALLIAGLILGVFIVYFISTIVKSQRRNQILHKEKIDAEITTQELERTRIASDLHDDLGPMLSAVKLLIGNIDLHTEVDKQTVVKANNYIDSILLQLRAISNDLIPMSLARKGLIVALQEFISDLGEKRLMKIDFCAEPALDIPNTKGIHIYRIIHEVIHNADKHAGAQAIQIRLFSQNKLLILSLKDNGCGFDTKNVAVTQKGFGLRNIMSRVEALRGNIYLNSGPTTGTEYIIEIPI